VITNVTWSPAQPASGNEIAFTATIKNQGTAATPTGQLGGVFLGVAFKVDGQWATWHDTDYASLAPGASITLTGNTSDLGKGTWTATTGTHTLTAIVDNMNVIAESNEANNTVSKTFTVMGPSGIATDTADTYVRDGSYAGTNYGSANPLYVRTTTSTGYNRQAYLKFDISKFPSVQKAVLTFSAALSSSAANVVANIATAPTTWAENTLTWNNKPAAGASLGSVSVSPVTTRFQVDVSSAVASQRAAGNTSVSFVIQMPVAATPPILVSSRESTQPPTLIINTP
jgi:hypothetical protein